MKENILKIPFLLFILIACESSLSLNPNSSKSKSGPRSTQDNPNVAINNFESEVFTLVNDHRLGLGQEKLKWHDQAIIEAQDHNQDMAAFRVPFGHIGFSERIDRIKSKETETIKKSGENVAKNSSATKAVNAWLSSYGHRKNIEGDYTHTGIGVIKSSNGHYYYTQIFLKK